MATYEEWNNHFDKLSVARKNQLYKNIYSVLKDNMIDREYGSELGKLAVYIQSSIMRNKKR
jgi:hypothetical protein